MNAALATLPILVTLGLLALGVRALYASLAALATALVLTATSFRTPLGDLGDAQLHMLPTIVELGAILFGGILLSELMTRTGAQSRMGNWIGSACSSPSRAVLLVMLGVTPFAESLTGFGIGVIVAIPLLRQLGLPPAKAAVVGLLGLVTVPWGSLAPGSLVAAELGDVDFQQLGIDSALLSAPVFLICGAATLVVALGARRALASAGDLLLAVAALWGTVWAVNTFIGVPLAGVLGGLVTMVVLLVVSRMLERDGAKGEREPIGRTLSPYAFLVAGLLVSRLILESAGVKEGWWTVVAGPGGWLLVTAALTPKLLGAGEPVLGPAAVAALGRWWQVTLTTVVFLTLGTVLTVTGMSRELAEACATIGSSYLVLAPWIGAVGGFLAGSNTGANAMFAASQANTAEALGYSTGHLVAVQNVSAALASGASSARVVLAAQLAQNAPGPAAPPKASQPAGTSAPSSSPSGSATGTMTTPVVQTTVTADADPDADRPVDTRWVLRTVLSVHALVFLTTGAIAVLWQ
ncbi:L-lactate permease [Streptomyces telluris]|uniref:L-lactate permease n=1 Tax=Streptomyces telluris TaxID=2720021 RepID=A0A9X2RLK4_9ACTN|nr:L-lactate permease [Streptomyces telluris]MCQ8770968.1 L-lactate permease [Streptomyces telluris]NJP75751.1 L-lactate permease [Streptomyces telluris]